jgi:predicted nuclease of predicted toxin-antitoxin system
VKFLLDHCVPNRVADVLTASGHEVIKLRECLPTDSSDSTVIAMAEELDGVLVSLNGDFADITAYPPASHRGIIALQVRNRPETIRLILDGLLAYIGRFPERRDMDGKLLLVEPHRIRVRNS